MHWLGLLQEVCTLMGAVLPNDTLYTFSPLPFESPGDTCGDSALLHRLTQPISSRRPLCSQKMHHTGQWVGALATLASALVGVFDPGS